MTGSSKGIFTPKFLLRIAAGIMALHLVGHLFGHLNWRKTDDAIQQSIIKQMNEHELPFMGATHSIGDYYEGYGWISSIGMMFFITTLLFSSSAYGESPAFSRKVTLALAGCLIILGGVEFTQFFAFAAVLTWLTAVLIILANYSARNAGVKV